MRKVKRLTNDAVVGIDQSATGTAAVALVDGYLGPFLYFADTKKAAREKGREACGEFEVYEPVVPRNLDDEVGKTRRLRAIRDALTSFLRRTNPTHVAFEGYSMTRAPVASRVLGEVGGVLRLLVADLEIPFRVYPVEAIKTFATGRGDAEKAEMILACRDQWEARNWTPFGKTEGAAGNLADAYVIAQLLRLELRVRRGDELLEDLEPRSRSVLQRVTPKRQPVPILETPFAEVPR